MSRYRVERDEHHGGGLFELEITIEWRVIDVATGAIVRRFRDDDSASYDGVGWSGGAGAAVLEVAVTEAEDAIEVRYRDGRCERVAL